MHCTSTHTLVRTHIRAISRCGCGGAPWTVRDGKEEGPNKTRQIFHSSPAVCVRISYRASLKQQAIFPHQMWKGKSRTMRSLLLSLSVCVHVQQGQKYCYVCTSSAITCFEVSEDKKERERERERERSLPSLFYYCTCTCSNTRKIPLFEGLHGKDKTQRPISAPVHKTCNFIHDILYIVSAASVHLDPG